MICRRPLCFFCAGRMLPIDEVDPEKWIELAGDVELFEKVNTASDEVYVCPDCGGLLFRGLPQSIIDQNIENESKNRQRGMIHKHGNQTGKKRNRRPKQRFVPWYQRYY